jgi:hypothetical protein
VTLTTFEIQTLVGRIQAGIGAEDDELCEAAFEALTELSDAADEAMADVQALRDAIYDASKL